LVDKLACNMIHNIGGEGGVCGAPIVGNPLARSLVDNPHAT
jgi:hypothetical protein